MRDPRFPRHADVKDAIFGWASDGKPYTAEEVREGVASALDATPELQEELFRPESAMTKWENYVAHGLSWLSRPPEAHTLGPDGYYHLTELGKVMASRLVDKKWLAGIRPQIDEAIASMSGEAKGAADGGHKISKIEIMLDEITETTVELATNRAADAEVLVNNIEALTASLRTILSESH